ncbi:MAG TPA: non-canonical purine NTP pyrophosphatase [Pirellulales bacterium]|jgi:XTP/dITP diphosphohydrolase|nr:non-canonical purine NTP pyrophosphatase [Pirellulales bacterium]
MQVIQHAGRRTHRLMLGTTNRGKIAELVGLLAARLSQSAADERGLEAIVPARDLPDVEETGATVAENAAIKAAAYARACGQWTLADDTALAVDALGGAPGVHTARFAGPRASPADNRRRLLAELADVPLERRGAHFTCHLALADPTGAIRATSEGRCHGRICTAPAGDEGFGYDPLFEIVEFRRTFAELGLATRGVLSHRARAMEKMIPHIVQLLALGSPTKAEG